MDCRQLPAYLDASASRWPERPALVDPSGTIVTYAELSQRSSALARFLMSSGVARGDRVGVVLPKSAAAVTTLFGIMKAGAAYVPVDVSAPLERGRRILTDCGVRAVVVDTRALAVVPDGLDSRAVIGVGAHPAPDEAARLTTFDRALESGGSAAGVDVGLSDLAYILYTSGSTGVPKGVMLTHENASSFVEWASSVFQPDPDDRFSSHAPFHFDLSVLDIYVAIKHGAALYLISEDLGKSPRELARYIAENRLTVWYSTPSILMLLTQFGALSATDASALRLVLFAGEVFPVKHLRELKRLWPRPAYYNLYGPTETNVCTFARIPDAIPADRDTPYPIGFACSHCATLVLDDGGDEVAVGQEGLLYISGPSVFGGYWNRPAENAAAFIERHGTRWYNTGDVVRWNDGEGFLYLGRKDRMVKRRGYRIELGEIERALYAHPALREVAVVAVPDTEAGVKIVAFLSPHPGQQPSIVDLKVFCATKTPAYMSPDRFLFHEKLPRTSTDKVDYQALRKQLEAAGRAASPPA
jgi:amino acid adenylation domain-containing protein